MQAEKSGRPAVPTTPIHRSFFVAIIVVILFAAIIYLTKRNLPFQPVSLPEGTVTVSQRELEEKYGLQVSLVAVTASGGLVDLRLKMLDGEKAKLLLADKKNFPALFSEHGVTLNVSADTKSQNIKFDDGSNFFIMYPNSDNAVTQGSPITILFGDTALTAINVK